MATGQKTEFTINARDKTKRGLTTAQTNLKKTSKEADRLAGRFRNVARATVIMEGPLGGTAGRLSAMATMMNNVNVAAVATGIAIAGMTAIAYKSITAFSDWQTQTLKVNSLLEVTGYSAGLAGSEIEEMAINIGLATLESADSVRQAAAVLLTFKSVSGDAFESTLKVATDLSILTGQGLKQSVIQLGKALEDPATGMSALRRSGVSFLNSQKDVIVAMKESGDTAGAQAELLKLLQGQLGGTGAAAGGGLAGAADLLSERWTNMLVKLSETGAGQVATNVLNSLAAAVKWFQDGLVSIDSSGLKAVNDDIEANQKELNKLKKDNSILDHFRIKLLEREYVRLLDKRELVRDGLWAQEEEIRIAREKGELFKKNAREQSAIEAAALKAAKAKKDAESQFKTDSTAASGYALKLIAEEQALQTSLLNKSQQEDIYFEERMAKIALDQEAGLLSKEEAYAAEQAAFSIHSAKLTEIHASEKEKQEEQERRLGEMQVAATKTALTDISSLMQSSSKKLFAVGKVAAIANSLINTYQAVTKTMTSVPYPLNIPLAAAQGAAGLVQVQKIKSQKISAARVNGGPVIAGRRYKVGENGVEEFVAPSSGRIINNNNISNSGGIANAIDVTVITERGEEYIDRSAEKIWNVLLDRMNENGMRFA